MTAANMEKQAGDKRAGKAEFAAHWPLIAAAFIGIMVSAWALPMYWLGPLSKSLETAFGWPRDQIMACQMFLAIGTTTGTPLAGLLADRLPARPIVIVSMLIMAACVASVGLLQGEIGHIHLLYFLMGFLGAGSGGLIFTRVIGIWFHSARGLAIGIALAGSGAGAFATPLVWQSLLTILPWREASFAMAAIILLIAMPIVLLGLRARTVPGVDAGRANAEAPPLSGVPLGAALRDLRFYILLVSVSIFGAFIGGLVINIVPMLVDSGYTPMRAAQVASLLGIAIIAGRLIVGSLLDRYPAALVGFGVFALGASGALLVGLGGASYAVIAVLSIGLLLGAEVDLLSFMALRYFGNRYYGKIYGLLFFGYSGLAMATPYVTGSLIALGGYPMLWLGAAIGFGLAGLLLLGLFAGPGRQPAPAVLAGES